MQESAHFADMLREREIDRSWIDRTLNQPELDERRDDGTRHFAARVPELGNRWLRVVVNTLEDPPVLVTAFFDRHLRKRHESQGRQED